MHVADASGNDQASATQSVRMAVAQMTIRTDPSNISQFHVSGEEIRQLMKQARAAKADLLHLQEGATCWPDKYILSESGPNAVGAAEWNKFQWSTLKEELEAIRRLAQELGLWVVFGSVHQLTNQQRPHNSLYVVSDEGSLVTRYDERMLSNTKISYMYTPGTLPIIFEVNGLRFGCALGMESHFPEVFIEYEQLGVDCVLFSTTGGSTAYPNDTAFTAEVLGHAASNSYWVSYAVAAKPSAAAISGIVTPWGEWAAQCASDGTPSITVCDIDDFSHDPSRPWRRKARSGIYDPHQVKDDPRSEKRDVF
jgi:predicted amidohydrolase